MAEAKAEFEVEFVGACPLWRGFEDQLAVALGAAAALEQKAGAVAVLLGDDERIAALNKSFRGKDGPTNVLSFPGPRVDPGFLGDIALAAETIAEEANSQGKSFEHHAAHLAVHGFLHLLGYDHDEPDKAEVMEARERAILASIGIADPYA
ncbi:rRNA maturation RNase YbeY [Terricaulis sp.]|uniref:rRNA maturation RNase YbeY n=1 Tax=Terricaulis sp. TaxID=2768686 RepID=UPI003783ED5B